MSRSSTKKRHSERRRPTAVPCWTSLNLLDLRQALGEGLDQRELLKLIVEIDKDTADWDFTRKLHKYFAAEVKKYEKEVAEDTAHDQAEEVQEG